MPACAVLTCKARTKGPSASRIGVTFHPFPKDHDLKEKWIDMTGRNNWTPNKDSVVCSKHFRDNDYFIKRSGHRYLRNGAIPCEHVVYRLPQDDEYAVTSPSLSPSPSPSQDGVGEGDCIGPSPTQSPSSTLSPTPPPSPEIVENPYPNKGEVLEEVRPEQDFNDFNDNTVGWGRYQHKVDLMPNRIELSPPLDHVNPPLEELCTPPGDFSLPPGDFCPPLPNYIPPIDLPPPIQKIKKIIAKRGKHIHQADSVNEAYVNSVKDMHLQLQGGKMNHLQIAIALVEHQCKVIRTLRRKQKAIKDMYNEIAEVCESIETN